VKKLDWKAIQDGLGSAAAVPGLVVALGSGKKAQRTAAFVELGDERLVHQGQRSPAAPLAVSLLVDALSTPKHPAKELVLALLASIAVGDPGSFFRGGAGPDALAALAANEDVPGRAFHAVRAAHAEIAAQLGDKSAAVRAQAGATLAFVDPSRAEEALRSQLLDEKDDHARIAALLGLGLAMKLGAPVADLPAVPRTAHAAVRAARAIGQAVARRTTDAAILAQALTSPVAETVTPFGRLGDAAVGGALALGDVGQGILARALAAAPQARKGFLATAIVQGVFPGATQGALPAPLLPSSALPGETLDALRLVARSAPDDLWGPLAWLPSVGITEWLPDLKRFLGVDPPGPLEMPVVWRGVRCEAVVLLDTLARGQCDEAEARSSFVSAFDPDARVDFAILAAGDCYQLHNRAGWTPERSVAFASSLLDEKATLRQLCARAAGSAPALGYGALVVLDALLRLSPKAVGVDLAGLLAFAPQMARGPQFIDLVRRAFVVAPASVRDELAHTLDLPDLVERVPKLAGVVVEPSLGAWNILDLAANRGAAARRAALLVASWMPTPRDDWDVHPVEAAKRALAALRPESLVPIEEALPSATKYGRSILQPLLRPS